MNLSTILIFLAQAEGDSVNPIAQLFPFLLIGLAFYGFIIRPQRKRQAEQSTMLRRVGVGDDIVTIGGMHGTIVELDDDTMELEIAPGVLVTMARNAISKPLNPPAPLTLDDLDDDDDFDDDDFDDDDDLLDDVLDDIDGDVMADGDDDEA